MLSTIIRFRAHGNLAEDTLQITFSVEAPTANLPDAVDASFTVNPAALAQFAAYRSDPTSDTDVVRNAGKALFDSLLLHHNANHALSRTIQAANGSPGRQIRLQFPRFAASAQNLPWELLLDPAIGFLELGSHVPVVREIEPKYRAPQPTGSLPVDGLRVLSVIAANGIPGHGEWLAVESAVAQFGRPFRLHLLVSDRELHDEIVQATGQLAGVSVEMVPSTKAQLIGALRTFGPQICHFFCHGRSVSGGYLEIANGAMEYGGNPHVLTASDLEDVLPGSAWLVVLNACSGAEADPDAGTSSLAARLVREGVPIVVGMRDEVPSDIVGRFTRAFLTDALTTIARVLAGNSTAELDLGPCLTRARGTICDSYPGVGPMPTCDIGARVKEWALPVMSVSSGGFRLSPQPAGAQTAANPLQLAELTGQLETLRRMKDLMDAALTETQRATIDAKIRDIQGQILALMTV